VAPREAAPGIASTIAELGRAARRNPDLALLAVLLVLTAIFSRSFSKGVSIGPIYITELIMLAAGAIAVVRLGGPRTVGAMLRRLPLPALALIWVVGAIATVRGLQDYNFSLVSHDIGLVDYTLVLPLLALVLVDRRRYEAMYTVLVACGFAGIAAFAIHFASDHASGQVNWLWPLQGAAAGLYMSFAVAWIVARAVNGVPTSRWLLALVPTGLILMSLTTQRSAWLVALVTLGAIVALAPRPARARSALLVAGALVAAFVLAIGIERGVNAVFGDIQEQTNTETTAGGSGGSQLSDELTSVGGGSEEGQNISWRLAYWSELIERTPSRPFLGAGFGEPIAFTWNDRKYDFRDGDPETGLDVAGPHNSFIAFLYRLGIPAFLALCALLVLAARNVRKAFQEGFADVGERVMLTTLVGMLLAGTVSASFNEALVGPFLGLFFWVPLAMLLLWPSARRA